MIDPDRFYASSEALSRDSVPVTAELMPGQIVVPRSLLESHAHLNEMLADAFTELGMSLRSYTIGSDVMPRDPETGNVSYQREPAHQTGTILTGHCSQDREG